MLYFFHYPPFFISRFPDNTELPLFPAQRRALAASTEMIGEGEAGGEELKEPEQPEEEEKLHPLFDKKKKKSEPKPRKTKVLNP